MRYEQINTRTQPPCGSKPAKVHEFHSVTTDDPVAYVRQREGTLAGTAALEVINDGKGTVTVAFTSGAQEVTYEFTED